MEHHEIVIAHDDLGGRGGFVGSVDHSWINKPGLTGVFKVLLHATPLVPCEKTVETNKEQSKQNQNDNSNFCSLDKVASNIIDDGGIELITERQSVDSRYWKTFWFERDAGKGIVDVLFQELERSVDTGHENENRELWRGKIKHTHLPMRS